jgi:membrane-anchored protein YejM (alkaline phosphatase superfamily)
MILTESVRADALCSDPPPTCRAPFLDEVVPDRIALGKLGTQSPGTFSACMMVWTGLPPTASVEAAHAAPLLWEIAHAVGYRTAYVTSQNTRYEDFAAFVERAGIDELVTPTDLGGMAQLQIGAPDERATDRMLRFAQEVPSGTPYFAVLHLSNTHMPYRVDPALQPFVPHSDDPLGDIEAFHNHYSNAVHLQERTVATFLRGLRALPAWDDTVVVFLSDHGEQFRERGGLYHIHSLYDEEVRVPGWLVGGPRAIDEEARASIRSWAGHRTWSQDIHATIVDLLGVSKARNDLPFAKDIAGRSLLRPRGHTDEPTVLLSTSTGVWEADDPKYGVMRKERLLVGSVTSTWC